MKKYSSIVLVLCLVCACQATATPLPDTPGVAPSPTAVDCRLLELSAEECANAGLHTYNYRFELIENNSDCEGGQTGTFNVDNKFFKCADGTCLDGWGKVGRNQYRDTADQDGYQIFERTFSSTGYIIVRKASWRNGKVCAWNEIYTLEK